MPMRRHGAPDMRSDPGAPCTEDRATRSRPDAADAPGRCGDPVAGRPDQGTGPGAGFHHEFTAEPMAVRDALRRAVARFARQLSAEDAGTLELVLAEALNNIAEHAYAGQAPGRVMLALHRAPDALDCVIEDDGRALPGGILPDAAIQPVAENLGDLAEGGWGWALIRILAQDIRYCRRDGRNRLGFRILLGGG
ncbi:MAG: ATP-binding protein [Alphaproteobacteria bacterium HGW-Alphaproteobacteria-6]|nr:MAG: ATP-binding protein [Alphaproteobacteria bacterium HGW-Alphaproteobacteria-6]